MSIGICAFQPQQHHKIANFTAQSSATSSGAQTTTTTSTTRIRIRVDYQTLASLSPLPVTTGPLTMHTKRLLHNANNGLHQVRNGACVTTVAASTSQNSMMAGGGLRTTVAGSTMTSSTMTATSIRCRTPNGVSCVNFLFITI